jgi:cytochrome b
MSVEAAPTEAGTARVPATVKVWDPFVRIFHWSLVALFVLAYATGDESERLHIWSGYAIAGLVALRIAWGLLGPPHARFSDFVRPPREVLQHLRDTARGAARRHLGHNPAGGAMVVALLTMLAGTCASGYLLTTDVLWQAKWVEEVHEAFANITVALIIVHVLGVLVACYEQRENLVAAMFTGRKRPIA